MSTKVNFSGRLLLLRSRLKLTQAALANRLGISRSYYNLLENGTRQPSKMLEHEVDLLLNSPEATKGEQGQQQATLDVPGAVDFNRVPIVGWCQAGEGWLYEDLPDSWHDFAATTCPDKKAIGIIIEGDSMLPEYHPGDIAIVMPSIAPRNGCLVVARHKTDGVMFKKFSAIGKGRFRFTSLNPYFPPFEHNEDQFHWIYPVFEVHRKLWS